MSFTGYLKKLIKARRAHPKNDLVTALVQARDGRDQLSEDEVLAMIFILLVAGHETTVNLDTVSISKGGEKEEETEIWGCLRGIS
jgi:cytochrome P450